MRKTKNDNRKANSATRVTRAALVICVTAGLYSFFDCRSSLLSAQDSSQPRPFTTEVNYVRVDMYPTSGDTPVIDLRQDEVELLEDGVAQKIAQFEHISVSGPVVVSTRPEPSTMAEMRRAIADPRARV